MINGAVGASKSDYVQYFNAPSKEALVRRIENPQTGLLLRSSNTDYSDIIIQPSARRAIQSSLQAQMGDSAMQHVANAVDARRAELIKTYDVEQEQVHVSFDKDGSVRFFVFDEDGTAPYGNTPPSGIVMNQVDLLKRTRADFRKTEESRNQHNTTSMGRAIRAVVGMPNTPVGVLNLPKLRTKVNWSSAAAAPFGGNRELTHTIMNQWVKHEDFVINMGRQSGAPASGGQTSVEVMGLGANLNVWGNKQSPNGQTWRTRFQAASGNAQKVMDVTSEFIAVHHKNLPTILREHKLPVPDSRPFDRNSIAAVNLVADAMWLGGDGLGRRMAKIISTSKTKKEALAKYNAIPSLNAYRKNGTPTERNKLMRGLIDTHYAIPR